jgi:hypothetical protein
MSGLEYRPWAVFERNGILTLGMDAAKALAESLGQTAVAIEAPPTGMDGLVLNRNQAE